MSHKLGYNCFPACFGYSSVENFDVSPNVLYSERMILGNEATTIRNHNADNMYARKQSKVVPYAILNGYHPTRALY